MIYQVQCEFIPGNSSIWVAQLQPGDPIYEYNNEPEAQAKADELQAADPTGRLYRVIQL
jgi:ribosomal protein L16/L10AE